jgi:hypothetical protein
MNPTTTILSLVAAALAGVTIVTFNDADLAKQEVVKAKEDSLAAIRASGAKVAAAERKTCFLIRTISFFVSQHALLIIVLRYLQ